jgi:pilus assembly protein CpaE
MQPARPHGVTARTGVVVCTADPAFEQLAAATFKASAQIDLRVFSGSIIEQADSLDVEGAAVVIVDLDAGHDAEMQSLERLMTRLGAWPPVVVVTQSFDADVARLLLQMRVADFLQKPVQPVDLVRACARVAKPTASVAKEAQIHTFLPAVGGAGVTTIAIQTAMLLRERSPKGQPSTCLVDLNFQNGACADYLDLEPRLDLKEIEPRPERLDRQLLEVMLSQHHTGISLIAAPNRPAEMRTFDPDMVTRLLDLVSSHFDYVVIDMPRTWFSWTDNVLLGSNQLYIVSEMTVPSLRHAKGLVAAIRERLGDGPRPQVIVNRFEQKMFAPGLKKADIEQALGIDFAGTIPNSYQIVREAIDRGVPLDEVKPGNQVTQQLRKLVLPQPGAKGEAKPSFLQKLSPSWAR